jgi:DNA-binding IclR family transcriptional regulator
MLNSIHVVRSQPDKMEKMQFNPAIIRKVLDTLKGQNVIARNDRDGFYYPGKNCYFYQFNL